MEGIIEYSYDSHFAVMSEEGEGEVGTAFLRIRAT
jgi:hypothetical protein